MSKLWEKFKGIILAVLAIVTGIFLFLVKSGGTGELKRKLRKQKVDSDIDRLEGEVIDINSSTKERIEKAKDATVQEIEDFWDDRLDD